MQGIPLFLSGDLHALAEGRILRYGNLDLRRNPVVSVLTGPISTGPKAWPSAWRGTPPRTPTGIEVEAGLNPLEKNGFSIIDFTEDRIEGQMFSWKMDEPEERLNNLKPFHQFAAARRHVRQRQLNLRQLSPAGQDFRKVSASQPLGSSFTQGECRCLSISSTSICAFSACA